MNVNFKPIIGIVSPCYNEEQVLNETINQLHDLIVNLVNKAAISDRSFVALVDDGSKDATWNII
jgi:glycosyltransferase involved in cell wall biosynthesis